MYELYIYQDLNSVYFKLAHSNFQKITAKILRIEFVSNPYQLVGIPNTLKKIRRDSASGGYSFGRRVGIRQLDRNIYKSCLILFSNEKRV